MATKDEVLSWFQNGDDNAQKLIDLKWKVSQVGPYTVLQNDKIPFTMFLTFNDDNTLNLLIRTGIETATIDNQERLTVYRVLLILNKRVEMVKFMLDGINEEVVAREDMVTDTLTKDEINAGLNAILTAFYLMVQALHLEDQFNSQIIERTYMMIKNMADEGKSRDEIKDYLKKTIGLRDEDAEKLISEVLDADKAPSNMYQ
ncbi:MULTISPECIES: hypothetical protein [Acidiplasma]|jgi:hypothetical protein|uniref:Uncharacterized protein n=2 Tax=Acidiplasma TaxID=507753 RepID=A0A0Q0VN62_9ARCH|nr:MULTISPECIES: hypothetical protein [Acidiplasma]KJE49271.1 hypothetical protein TZ01_04205 [Acidiplasma sp. MBA-1]KQB34334.1 hypothetical protein AOG54_05140 [Acidiplasma aeolicum]KQB34866.1 hypothetical protein AOG55_08855 [Acidiplasma cupricumulans]WMT54754.1 MAG: hypothetical protein RE470_07540 [Acidiplasma sp.]